LIGASGFLGSYITQNTVNLVDTTLTGTSTKKSNHLIPLDICVYDEIVSIINEYNPDCIINCAAMADVEKCERNPVLANKINSVGPENLAKISDKNNIRLIHVSTDSVFDGRFGGYLEESTPSPINVYSRTKLEGEEFVRSLSNDYVILRTNFYGLNPRGSSRMNWILQNLKNNEKMTGVVDQVFNPLWVRDVANVILKLSIHSYKGILNCTGNEVFTKYQFIKEIANVLGYKTAKINEGFSDDVFTSVRRPSNTILCNAKMRNLLNIKIHSLHEVLLGSDFNEYRANEVTEI
jgi:dTDP-4-dehydrorhamnose reductase